MHNHISRDDIEKNLIDIGCNNQQIQYFFKYYDDNDKKNSIFFLRQQRYRILEKVHQEQKKLDYLDYLVYALKKNSDF